MKKPNYFFICFFLLSLLLLSCSTPEKQDQQASAMSTEPQWDANQKIAELGIELAEVGAPTANFVHAVKTGNLIFLSGKGPKKPDGTFITGKLGADVSIEEGYEAARLTGIAQLEVLKTELGDLNKVKRIVNVLGMVNCVPEFKDQSAVVNGYSDLMVAVFGDKGKHTRAAVGMSGLPGNIATEIGMIVEIEE